MDNFRSFILLWFVKFHIYKFYQQDFLQFSLNSWKIVYLNNLWHFSNFKHIATDNIYITVLDNFGGHGLLWVSKGSYF